MGTLATIIGKCVWPIIRAVSGTALGQGILLWLAEKKIFVSLYVARMIGVIEAGATAAPEWVNWILAGAFGLAVAALWPLITRLARFIQSKNAKGADLPPTQLGSVSEEPSPPTWLELEQRFRELEAPLQLTRIDGQTGAAGEHWRWAGSPSGDAGRRFRAIAAMASARLFQDFPSKIGSFPELESESDPVIRWYKALKFIADRYEEGQYAEQINDDGSSAGFIFMGSIERPAAASATLCLELASRPIEKD